MGIEKKNTKPYTYYIMYTDLSTTSNFPKTLVIRNHTGGMIWQIYHPDTETDVNHLTTNASRNGFMAITLEDYQPEHKETWSNWRETKNW